MLVKTLGPVGTGSRLPTPRSEPAVRFFRNGLPKAHPPFEPDGV